MDLDARYQAQVEAYFLRTKKATYHCVAFFVVGLLLGVVFFKSYGIYIFTFFTGVGLVQLFIKLGYYAFICPSCHNKVPFTSNGSPAKSCPHCDAGNFNKSEENRQFKDDILVTREFNKQRDKQKIAHKFLHILSAFFIVVFVVIGLNKGNILPSLQLGLYFYAAIYFIIVVLVQLKCPVCKKKLSLVLPNDIKYCPHCHAQIPKEEK